MNTGRLYFAFCTVLLCLPGGCKRATVTTVEPSVPEREALIVGGSMHPSLRGEHYLIECVECRFPFRFDAHEAPQDHVVCPNCGSKTTSVELAIPQPADRVLIEPVDAEQLKRFDVVAVKHPDRPGEFAVKRIVGLPGERIEIRNGELFVDGEIFSKSFRQQLETAILIHDSNYEAPNLSAVDLQRPRAPRWSLQEDDSQNKWLQYRHIRGYRGRRNPRQPDAVEDFYPFNQKTVRFLHRVRDLAVQCELPMFQADETFTISFQHLTEALQIELELRAGVERKPLTVSNIRVQAGEREILNEQPAVSVSNGTELFCSIFDQRILIAIDGKTITECDCVMLLGDKPCVNPILISAKSETESPMRLKLFRDVHYLGAGNENLPWSSDGNEFVLLGDNVPVSIDSRNWTGRRVPADSILGIAKPVATGDVKSSAD